MVLDHGYRNHLFPLPDRCPAVSLSALVETDPSTKGDESEQAVKGTRGYQAPRTSTLSEGLGLPACENQQECRKVCYFGPLPTDPPNSEAELGVLLSSLKGKIQVST